MKDEEIIRQIRNGEHDSPIRLLYKEYPKVRSLILSADGNSAEARETFHDALILLMEKIGDPSFRLTSKLTTYLYGITRLLWKNKLRKQQKNRELEWADTLILTNEDVGIEDEKEARIRALEAVLKKVTARCREIFQRFYFQKESMDAIAKAMGFSSVNSAKTQKYKCMEQAMRFADNINLKNA